ncbi:hypothetical protein LOC67_17225 [Stieleria sp. JC731]|uniref:hypothetical protein n=1 Tax=Pirellulaceae TaxID=2691357 RepID=UPI001E3D9ABA|nr:hypothetical protein [Stieleria sp. JC731]MCC9602299.1 hypothetical protein [Stieleria sp. JC731]
MRQFVVILIVVVLLAILGYHAIGTRLSGRAKNAADVPIVGGDLSELHFLVPAEFRGNEHPHGGGAVIIQGAVTKESMVEFCQGVGAAIGAGPVLAGQDFVFDRRMVLEQLRHFNMLDDPIRETEGTLVLAAIGGRFRKMYGTYEPATQQFLLYVQFDGTK